MSRKFWSIILASFPLVCLVGAFMAGTPYRRIQWIFGAVGFAIPFGIYKFVCYIKDQRKKMGD